MSKRNPNKLYSLRKLKTGTASVAVALTVLGTGLANTTDVKAESRRYQAPPRVLLQGKEANKVFEERKPWKNKHVIWVTLLTTCHKPLASKAARLQH